MPIASQDLNGWVVEKRRSHYSLGYWIAFVLGMFGQMVPDPPRITYTLKHGSSGERHTVTLPGDHKPSDLADAVARVGGQPARSAQDTASSNHREDAMPEIKTEFLFRIALEVPSIVNLGDTPYGGRRIAQVASGTFEGPKLKGRTLPGGGDWLLLRHDGVLQLDVRLTLETEDKQLIYMTYKGFRHGPKEVIERLNKGESVDPSLYYFRSTPYFETSSEKYAWMNGICSVATGSRSATGPSYHVFQVL